MNGPLQTSLVKVSCNGNSHFLQFLQFFTACSHISSLGLINSGAIEVDLSYSLIEVISTGMFSAASACEILNLSYNSINTIETDAFQVNRVFPILC